LNSDVSLCAAERYHEHDWHVALTPGPGEGRHILASLNSPNFNESVKFVMELREKAPSIKAAESRIKEEENKRLLEAHDKESER
jgi:hypothetical protein